jgi:mono/diheme cytochrome c family protein
VVTLALSGCGQTLNAVDLKTVSQTTQTAQASDQANSPLISPSKVDGATIFSQNCASCHTTEGQGEFKDISPVWLKTSTPKEAFNLISFGHEGQGMPAFTQLSTREIWNVVAYLFAQGLNDADLHSTSLIYQNLCLSCHGSEGQGDGTLAVSRALTMTDWQNQPLLPNYSDEQLFSIIRDGKGSEMNAFAVMLSEPQTENLSKVVRLLSIQEAMNFSPQSTSLQDGGTEADVLEQNQGFFTVEGNAVNVSGGLLDSSAEASLSIIANGQTIKKMNTHLLTSGFFRFILVPYSPEWNYVVTISHNGSTFNSSVIYGSEYSSAATAHLLLQVYDASTDINLLRGEQTHVMLEFNGDESVRVVEYVMISNHSSYVVVPQNETTPLLKFALPLAAQEVDLSNSTDAAYLKITDGGFGDWQSIAPGASHQVVFEYKLPFKGDDTLLFSFPVATTSVLVMVQDNSNQITCKGPQHLNQRSVEGGTLDIFSAVNLAAGNQLLLHCYNTSQMVPEIAGGAALLFGLLVVVLIVISKKKQNQLLKKEQDRKRQNTILDAIIVLDDSYKAGDLPKAAYEAKRAELVKQLEEERAQ